MAPEGLNYPTDIHCPPNASAVQFQRMRAFWVAGVALCSLTILRFVQGDRLFTMPHTLAGLPVLVELCWGPLSKGPFLVIGAQQLPSSDKLSNCDDEHWQGLGAFLSACNDPYPTQVSCQTFTLSQWLCQRHERLSVEATFLESATQMLQMKAFL